MIENIASYRKWNVKGLILCHIIIAFLLATYIFARPVWHLLDTHFFQAINSTLEGHKWWQIFWACANHRIADWVEDVFIIGFFAVYISQAPKYFKSRRVAEFLFCILLTALIIFFVNQTLFRENLKISNQSPTLIVENCVRLSHEVPWMKVKDMAARSFPGDHGTTALLFAGSILFFARRKLAIVACFYAAFLCTPRLITGAHWLSDVLVGSGSIALFFLSWAFFSPIHSICIPKIESFLKRANYARGLMGILRKLLFWRPVR